MTKIKTNYLFGWNKLTKPGEVGYHAYAIEFSSSVPPEDCRAFAQIVDEKLCTVNSDYAEHRLRDFAMLTPKIEVLPPGAFAKWMKLHGKLTKSRVILDATLLESLLAVRT